MLREGTQKELMQVHANNVSSSEFVFNEALGTECKTKCGGCRCGKCPTGSKNYTIKEERELAMIKNNLKFCENHCEATYPWIKDPHNLPNNEPYALKRLMQTEKQLQKDEQCNRIYCEQMNDMVEREILQEN